MSGHMVYFITIQAQNTVVEAQKVASVCDAAHSVPATGPSKSKDYTCTSILFTFSPPQYVFFLLTYNF